MISSGFSCEFWVTLLRFLSGIVFKVWFFKVIGRSENINCHRVFAPVLASSGIGRAMCIWLGSEPVVVPCCVFVFLGEPSLSKLVWSGCTEGL